MPTICQVLETVPTPVPPVTFPLPISHVSTAPLVVLCHSASLVRSPLKSPVPRSCQAPETLPTPVPPVTFPLVISHVSTAPVVVLRQRTSLMPSPLKSFDVLP